jgi:hypothetical protein
MLQILFFVIGMKHMENKQKDLGGRPTTFTKQKAEMIVGRVRTHLSIYNAAGLAREHHQTVFNWLKYGERDLMAGIESDFAKFFADTCEARAAKVGELLETIESMPKAWQAISWLLERCVSEEFGKESELYKQLLEDYKVLMQAIIDKKA